MRPASGGPGRDVPVGATTTEPTGVRRGSPAAPTESFGICRLCGGPTRPGLAVCYCCRQVTRSLRLPLAPVIAVTTYRVGDRMHRLLRGYTDAPVAAGRSACAVRLSATVDRWLTQGGAGWWARVGASCDAVVGVPSTSGRRGPPPVDRLIRGVPLLHARHRTLLVAGPTPPDHLVASRIGFAVREDAARAAGVGGAVLVVDDTFTTGARAQSAVAVLRRAGMTVRGVLVVGRAIDPDAAPWQDAYWRATGPPM